MKCLILAGGRGERLWPLSRVNFPKQFINVQKNHSIFQETVARNMAFCDEFIIVTNSAYRPIIANQMEAFQGVSYRCVFEEEPRKTLPAITLGCRGLQPSEFVFVVAADHLVDTGDCEGLNYKDAILKAKELAREGKIALFSGSAAELAQKLNLEDNLYELEGILAKLSANSDTRRIPVLIGRIWSKDGGWVYTVEAK